MANKSDNKKLSTQFCLTCATGAMVMVGLTTYIASISLDVGSIASPAMTGGLYDQLSNTSIYKPLKILMLGVPGAILGGVLGYVVGDMLDNPRGRLPDWYMKRREERRVKKAEANKPKEPIVTGEEIFLDEFDDELGDALENSAELDMALF